VSKPDNEWESMIKSWESMRKCAKSWECKRKCAKSWESEILQSIKIPNKMRKECLHEWFPIDPYIHEELCTQLTKLMHDIR